MKKAFPLLSLALAALFLVTTLFFWRESTSAQEDLDRLCQGGAHAALGHFSDYAELGHEGDYWYGVAQYCAFMNAYLTIQDGSTPEYLWCNQLYGEMVLDPETVQANMEGLLAALEPLAQDWTDPNAYLRINEFCNLISN